MTTTEILQSNLTLEHDSRAVLQEVIEACELKQDYISRDCAQGLLKNVEAQIDWIEEQEYLIANSGIENYLQSMMG